MPSLLSTIDNPGQSIYFTERFRLMIEDHLLILRNMATNRLYQITDSDYGTLNRYSGDFNGFLKEMGHSPKYHWAIMRVNGFSSRFELTTDLASLVLPDFTYLDQLAQLCKEKKA